MWCCTGPLVAVGQSKTAKVMVGREANHDTTSKFLLRLDNQVTLKIDLRLDKITNSYAKGT